MNIKQIVLDVRKKYRLQQIMPEWIEFLEYVETINPKIILEIGTASGASTLCFSHFADYVITVDCRAYNNKRVYKDIQKNSELHIVISDSTSNKCTRKILTALDGRKVDLLFIDGDHSSKGARRDFERFSPLVAPGGIVAFHDIANSKKHKKLGCDVCLYWNKIKPKYKLQLELSAYKWGGIGVIQL